MVLRRTALFLVLNLALGIPLLFGQTPAVKKTNNLPAGSNVPIAHDTIMPELTISFALTINGKPMDEIDAGIWNNEAIIKKDLAARLLFDYLRPDIYSTIFDTLFKGLTWLSAEDFAIAGIAFEFDSVELTIGITIPPEYTPVVDIDFVPEQVPNYKPILRPAPFAGFIQNESNLQVSNSSESTLFFSTKLYSMVDILGSHLFGSGYISLSQTSSSYYFDSLYALWEDNARKFQVSLGMITIPGTGPQTQPLLYAISLASVEDQRYIVRQGLIDDKTEFTIHKLAKVTVEVNGRPIRQVLLAPGNYRILDLPFTTGLNEFVLRIEETDGNVQILRRIVPRDNNILQVGASEFALSAGASTSDWNEFLGSGYYLYGFSPTFSGGINLQADKRSAMAGITWISALPIGTLNGSASVVGRWDGWGEMFAPAASVSYLFSIPERDFIPSLGISAIYQGYGFASPNISAPTDSAPDAYFSLSANLYSKIFAQTGASLGYSLTRTESSSPTMTHGIYASISQTFKTGGNATLSGQCSIPASGTPTFSAMLAFSIMPKDIYQRSFNYLQTSEGSTSVGILDKISALGQMFDVNLNANNLLPGSGDDGSVSLGIRNNSDYFDASASGTLSHEKSTDTYYTTGYAQFRTTMAFVGSHIAFTRQIPDSFLLITSAPTMKDEIASYKLSTGSQYLAKHGQNIVVPLTNYTTVVLSTDLIGSALNLNPRHPFVVVSPAYRSGILFESDVMRRYMITGRLADQNGKPIGYLPGDVYDIGGSLETSTFTDESGRFDIYDILPGTYRIEWPEGYGTTQFELPETENDSIDLGDIVIPIETK
jgi:outer membrane usher protein FimD/PapC